MIVLIVSECSGKSRQRSKRILDGYLPRIGRRTWSGAISADGLERLRKQVKEKASRTTAIACHKTMAGTMRLAWKVDAKHAFDGIGRVPIHQTGRAIRIEAETRLKNGGLLKPIATLSALFHDLGKASKPFFDKVGQGKTTADPIRHESISVEILKAAIETLVPADPSRSHADTDRAVLAAIADVPSFLHTINSILTTPGALHQRYATSSSPLPGPTWRGPLFHAICALVLTHHKMASSKLSADAKLMSTRTAFESQHHPGPRSDGLEFAGSWEDFGSQKDRETWARLLKIACTEAQAAIERTPLASAPGMDAAEKRGTIDKIALRRILAHGRIALVCGDLHASMEGTHPEAPSGQGPLLFANTLDLPIGAPSKVAQTLARHLVMVTFAARVAVDVLEGRSGEMPTIEPEELPDDILRPRRDDARFEWQAEAVELIQGHRSESRHDAPFLCFVMAGTGSGKTRAIPAILAAARGGLRYSIGLGLRTLTLQTGREYVSRIRLPSGLVSVSIGSPLAKGLAELRTEAELADLDAEVDGATSPLDEDPIADFIDGEAPVIDLPAPFHRWGGSRKSSDFLKKNVRIPKDLEFLAAPVMVCTSDKLVASVSSTRGNFTTQSLRIATSDLVLDEIDDYTPEDVSALCRLVELSASFGRSVVVSSATLPPAIAEAIHTAYRSGIAMKAKIDGKPMPIDIAWLSNASGTSRITTMDEREGLDFRRVHAEFTAEVAQIIETKISGRSVEFVDTSSIEEEDLHEIVRRNVRELHAQHHSIDPTTGRRVSAGVVRMSNVKPAIEMARELAENGIEGMDVVVACYVGSLVPALRHRLETALDRILHRPGETDPIVSPDSPLRHRIDAAATNDLTLVVVTTSIEETGRDHDFDFAIVEPSSARSLIQMAGRVRRHRPPIEGAAPNIRVLSHCRRAIVDKGAKGGVFSYPGPETPFNNAHGRSYVTKPGLPGVDARSLLDDPAFLTNVNAAPAIHSGSARTSFATFDHKRWLDFLDGPAADDGMGVSSYSADSQAYVVDGHRRARRFRRKSAEEIEIFKDASGWRKVLGKRWKSVLIGAPAIAPIPLSEVALGRMLVTMNEDELVPEGWKLADSISPGNAALRQAITTISLQIFPNPTRPARVRHHPCLGAYVKME